MKLIRSCFELDLRSLGVARIIFAFLILFDLIHRSQDLVAHYTDFGLLPRAAIIEHPYTRWHWSLHLMSGTWEVQALLFLIAGVCAVFLLLGYHTCLATIASWALMVSLNDRNPIIVVGDTLFRALLFWAIFLPWGQRFSVDALRRKTAEQGSESHFSAGSIAFVMQLIFVFWFGVIQKSGPEWRTDGTALYYALSFGQFTTNFGVFLLQFPLLLSVATHFAFWAEAVGPLLLMFPIRNGPVRLIGIALLLFLLLGIALTLNIGLFIWVTAAGLIALLPGCFWTTLGRWSSSKDWRNATVYYDGACGFCRTSTQVIRGFFPREKLALEAAQSFPEIEAEMMRRNSWVVIDQTGTRRFGFDGAVSLAQANPFFRWAVPLLERDYLKRWGNAVYAYIANHRRRACNVEPTGFSQPRLPVFSTIQAIIVFGLLGYVFTWNVATLPGPLVRFSERARSVGELLGLDQEWRMFAPFPSKDGGWYVIPGRLKNGQLVDLFNGGKPVTWAKPRLVSATFKSFRWQKYMHNLRSPNHAEYRGYFGEYLCRDWNRRHQSDARLEYLEVIYVLEATLPNYEYFTPTKNLIFKHDCGSS